MSLLSWFLRLLRFEKKNLNYKGAHMLSNESNQNSNQGNLSTNQQRNPIISNDKNNSSIVINAPNQSTPEVNNTLLQNPLVASSQENASVVASNNTNKDTHNDQKYNQKITQQMSGKLNENDQPINSSLISNHLISFAKKIITNWDTKQEKLYYINNSVSIDQAIPPLKFGEYSEITIPINLRSNFTINNNQKNLSNFNKYDRKPIYFYLNSRSDVTDIGLEVILNPQASSVTIKGTPLKTGDFEYRFLFNTIIEIDFLTGKLMVHEGRFRITVNPDPKTLWKEIEPTEELYRKPHTAHEIILKDNFLLAGASRRGRSHAHNGSFRDDDFGLTYLQDSGFCVIAVADGAGSCKLSRKGSQIACQTVISQITEKIQATGLEKIQTILRDAVQRKDAEICRKFLSLLIGSAYSAYQNINEESKSTGNTLKEFSTTLNITLIKKFDNVWFLGAFSIGDGGVAAVDKEGNVVTLNEYDEGEFAGQTRFITESKIWNSPEEQQKRLYCAFIKDLKYVFASTDGINDPYFPTMKDFRSTEKWNDFIQQLEKETGLPNKLEDFDKRLLAWLNFWSAGNHDDRTIAVFVA